MTLRSSKFLVLFALVTAWGFSLPVLARAALVYNFTETPAGVSGVLSGSLDLTNAVIIGSSSAIGNFFGIQSEAGLLFSEPTPGVPTTEYLVSSPPSFGTGGAFFTASATISTQFFIFPTRLDLEAPYANGTPITGTMNFPGATLAGLGISTNQHVYSILDSSGGTADTFTLNFSVVPLPAALPLLATGLVALGAVRYRRKRL